MKLSNICNYIDQRKCGYKMAKIYTVVSDICCSRLGLPQKNVINLPEDLLDMNQRASCELLELERELRTVISEEPQITRTKMIESAPRLINLYCVVHLTTLALILWKGRDQERVLLKVLGYLRGRVEGISQINDTTALTDRIVEEIESKYRIPRTDYGNILHIGLEFKAQIRELEL